MVRKPDLYVAEYPTGLDEKLSNFQNAVLLQQPQSGKPQIVGITGLGGVGKTTLAKHFFNMKKSDYTKSCFLSDIKDGSLTSLQRNLLKDLVQIDKPIDSVAAGQAMVIKLLKPSNPLTRSAKPVDSVDAGQEMPTKHHESSRALIVLDDVDHEDQVTAILPLETLDFLSHSLILITSRNKDVLLRARVAEPSIYVLTGLNTKCSRELFCSHAFSQDYPMEGFKFLTDKFLESCNGLPLSLKVYGALLYGKEMSEWKDELGRVLDEVKGKLKISYDALNKEEQHIFLDIACFLNGQDKDAAISIWNESGWTGRRGFQKLQDRCLVQVDSWNLIHMHEHLRDLGREIGEKSSPFRLWRWTETVIDDLPQQSHLMVRGLKMDRSDYNNYGDNVLGRIGTKRLRILDTEDDVMESILGMAESPHMERILTTRMVLPHILWLRWRNCPYSSLPSWMSVENLRHLEVSKSNLNALWQNQSQVPLQLRLLEVSACCELEELPGLETLASLEEFHANDCLKLKRIRGLEQCAKLRVLSVARCSELEELPSMGALTSMEEFYADGCVRLKRIRGLEQCSKLRVVYVASCSELEELPSMGALTSMEEFYGDGCVRLKRIRGLEQCAKLRKLHVRGCLELEEVEGVEQCTWLEELDISGCLKLQLRGRLKAGVQAC